MAVCPLYRQKNAQFDINEILTRGKASVRTVYHETSAQDTRTRPEPSGTEPPDDSSIPFFSYGTPFSNIVEFTRSVEEFTRHIDARTRK